LTQLKESGTDLLKTTRVWLVRKAIGCCALPEQRLVWARITTATALLCSFALSWRLWISSRLFPLSPASNFLPAIPSPFDVICLCFLLGLLAAIVIVRQPRWLILAFLALAGLLSLLDQERWQPWLFEYFFLLAAAGIYSWKKGDTRRSQTALRICRLIVVSTYLWSGLQKLNANFVRETWPDIAGPLLRFLPQAMRRLPSFLILIIPLMEIAIGLGLLTRRYRNLCVTLAIATHLFILMVLISSGENTVVWPWNVAMALIVVVLFWKERESGPAGMLAPKDAFHVLVLLLFGVLPALSFLGLWDSYLSSALYSGNTDQAVIYVSPAVIGRLPEAIRPHVWQSTQPFFLDINRWAYGELNVPVYPEPRVYRAVAAEVCRYAQDSAADVRLRILKKPGLFTGARESEYYDCDHVL
jgi:hypothetical protein